MKETIYKEDAIKAFDCSIGGVPVDSVKYVSEYADKMMSRISALPSAQPEFTNEEIRFALKQLRVYFAIKIRDRKEGSIPIELSQLVEEIQKYFENLPSAQPEQRKGEWIEHEDGLILCECSECHEKYMLYEEHVLGRNFCPNCGADMRGGNNAAN